MAHDEAKLTVSSAIKASNEGVEVSIIQPFLTMRNLAAVSAERAAQSDLRSNTPFGFPVDPLVKTRQDGCRPDEQGSGIER